MDLISVIVPIYKVEKYLDKCVSSIVNQTYRNLEIILVDDGSPDRCGAMCDAWAERDSRIKVIHKENGGLSDARNAGIACANGEYIGFIDSDDYIAPEMYQLLMERMDMDGSDIAACGVEMVFENGSAPCRLTAEGCCVLDRNSAMEAVIKESWLKQPVWYKLYKSNLVQDIPFPVGKYHEDVFWTYQVVARATAVSVFDNPCYFYRQRGNSIMGESFSLRRLDALEAKRIRLAYLTENFQALASVARIDLFYTCLYMGQMALLHMNRADQQTVFERVAAVRNRYPMTKEDKRSLPLKQRVWAILSNISFTIACRLRNNLKIGI